MELAALARQLTIRYPNHAVIPSSVAYRTIVYHRATGYHLIRPSRPYVNFICTDPAGYVGTDDEEVLERYEKQRKRVVSGHLRSVAGIQKAATQAAIQHGNTAELKVIQKRKRKVRQSRKKLRQAA